MKTNYYLRNKKTKEVAPIWFKGIDGTIYTSALYPKREYIEWKEVDQWERIKKSDIK